MDTDYRRAANITIIVMGIALLLWLFFKYAFGAMIPFILAALVAAVVSSPAKRIAAKTKLPQKLTAAAFVIFLIAAVCSLLYLAISRLTFELGNLLERLSNDPQVVSRTIEELIIKLNAKDSKLGILQSILDSEAFKKIGIDLDRMTESAISSIVSSLAETVSAAVMTAVSSVPSLILSVIVFLISAFYFAMDSDAISKGIMNILPSKWQQKLPRLKNKLTKTLSGYIKAYLLIMLITFLEIFIGLSVLGVNYAFIIAIIIAIVDVLPVLGTGTVLIPWSIFAFLSSDIALGIGLCVLYAVTIIVRQIIEPKIIGSTLGLHPLLTLASVYIGLDILGFIGIFIGPIIAMLFFRKDPEQKQTTLTQS